MLKRNINKDKKSQLFVVGSLLLILIGFSLIFIKYYDRFSQEKIEEKLIEEYFSTPSANINNEDNIISEEIKKDETKSNISYMAILDIPSINLKKGIFPKDSKNNNVDKNVTILNESDLPAKDNGNVILVAHSGTGYKAFFNNLSKLNNGDIAYLYYKNSRFTYKLVNQYEVEKTGQVSIKRNTNINTLTLITCKIDSNKQLVFIFEQYKEEF